MLPADVSIDHQLDELAATIMCVVERDWENQERERERRLEDTEKDLLRVEHADDYGENLWNETYVQI